MMNMYKLDNLKFSLFLPRFGLSLIDTSPKEFFYLEINSVKLMLKKVHDYFDVRLSVLDFQVLYFLKKLYCKQFFNDLDRC